MSYFFRQAQKKGLQAMVLLLLAILLHPVFSYGQEGSTMEYPIVMGTYPGGTSTYNDTRDNSGYGDDYGQSSEDIFYRFTVIGTTVVTISHCSSSFDTYLHLLGSDGSLIEYNDDNGPECSGNTASIQTTLNAGTYYIVSEGYGTNSGYITIDVTLDVDGPPEPVGARITDPIVIGTYGSGSYSYIDTVNNSVYNGYLDNYGQSSDDIYYQLTLQGTKRVNISHCQSGFDTYLHLLNSSGGLIASNDDNGPLCSGTTASISTTLNAGTYYIVVEGYGSNAGNITTALNLDDITPLYGGYVTNSQQTIYPGQTPSTINATAATGGNCGGSYIYQWQSAPVSGSFTNISGATGQNYSPGALTVTTLFRRRTICSGDTAYVETQGTVTVIQPLNGGCITSGNQTRLFGQLPSTIIATTASDGNCNGNYTYQWQSSPDNIYFTDIPGATSQNLSFSTPLTQTTWFQRKTICGNEVKYTGSVKVTMTSTITYYNVQKSGTFTRNNCGTGGTGSSVTYTVAADTYSSTVSQADADQQAQNNVNANGQSYANANGTCTFYNTELSENFYKQCSSGTGSLVTYTVYANTYSSMISQADANQQAQNDINANGQNYADTYGYCSSVDLYYNFSGYPYYSYGTMEFINASTYESFYFSVSSPSYGNYLGTLPAGNYNVSFYPENYGYYYLLEAGCGYSGSGYQVTLYDVNISSQCNMVTITSN